VLRQGGGSLADCFPVPVESDDLPCPDLVRNYYDYIGPGGRTGPIHLICNLDIPLLRCSATST
jgi:hypothetical protein